MIKPAQPKDKRLNRLVSAAIMA